MNDTLDVSQPNRRHLLLAGASLLALSGCGHLLGPEPGVIYVLSPDLPASSHASHTAWQLAVARPVASASLTTDRIALKRGQVMDYYADAQWTDAVPQLVQTLFVEALEKAGVSVDTDVAGIHADYILQSEIRGFDARYDRGDAAPTIEIVVTVKLTVARDGVIGATREFREEASAAANSIPAAVAAFDQAMSVILQDVVRWVLEMAARR